jgi:hypothetical protein
VTEDWNVISRTSVPLIYQPELAPDVGDVFGLSGADGRQVGEARVPRTMPFAYSGDEGVDVGADTETPVTEDYKQGNNRFTGKIHKVTVEVK